MAKKPTKRGRPSSRVLAAIGEGLEEIEVYFGWPGTFSDRAEPASDPAAAEVDLPDGEELDDDEDEDYVGENDRDNDGYVDREEIEVAIDSFIDSLLAAGIVSKSRSGKTPSFSDVFEKFFGEDHEIVAKAVEFEEAVEGYSGWISPDSMSNAENIFLDIQQFVHDAQKR